MDAAVGEWFLEAGAGERFLEVAEHDSRMLLVETEFLMMIYS